MKANISLGSRLPPGFPNMVDLLERLLRAEDTGSATFSSVTAPSLFGAQ
jgi:hypothetical protein